MFTIDHEDGRHELLTDEEFRETYKDKLTIDFFKPPFDRHFVNVDGEKLIINVL